MHYVIKKDGEKVKSCRSYATAKALVRHISGGVICKVSRETRLPDTVWRKIPYNNGIDLRKKPYENVNG